jgi:hypothetical protein
MASYFETRYLPPTNGGKGSRIRVTRCGSGTALAPAISFDYALGGGIEQHLNALRQSLAYAHKAMPDDVETAYATARGYVFRVEVVA